MQLSHFNYMLETFIHKMPSNCPIVIIGDFNIDLLTNTIQSTTLQAFMKKYNFKLTFSKSITISDTQIDHIWTNAPIQQCYFGST
jgi:endonuclease/exonuclease/phosphatase family metal-dependent hydrolase